MVRRTFSLAVVSGVALSTSLLVGQAPLLASTPQTQEVSVAMSGGTANGYGDRPNISGDASTVTFDSDATNMSTDPPGFGKTREVYARNLNSHVTRLVSIGVDGKAANAFTSYSWPDNDGRLVTFTSDATNLTNPATTRRSVFVRNMSTTTINGIPPLTTRLVSVNNSGQPANGPSSRSMITPNGQYIVYDSTATNLASVPTNGQSQEYLYNLLTHKVTLVSSDVHGKAADALSYRGMAANSGQTVAFDTKARNLVPGVTNGQENIYLKNVATGAISVVSKKYPSGATASGSRPYMTPDGKWITFNTNAALLSTDTNATTDVYVYNSQTKVLTLGSPGKAGASGNGASLRGFITTNGRYVVFNSFASNLTTQPDTNGHGDCFAFDTTTHTMSLITKSSTGGPANRDSFRPVPSSTGSEITFLSHATNLVPGGSAPAPSGGGTGGDDATTDYEAFAVALNSVLSTADTTKPSGTITSPKAGSTVTSPVPIAGTAADNVGVDHVTIAVKDNTTGGPNSGKWLQTNGTFGATAANLTTTLSKPGSAATNWSRSISVPHSKYLVQVTVVDTSGNAPSTKPNETFTVG